MNISLGTISFRHALISFGELVRYAQAQGFSGIELWGIHAQHLYDNRQEQELEELHYLRTHNMNITMISDYLDISPQADFGQTAAKCRRLIELAGAFGTNRIRTFAGQEPSSGVTPAAREGYTRRLSELCDLCGEHGVKLLIETHPNTLADTLASTLVVLEETGHEQLAINLDFLHLWEAGEDLQECMRLLEPWVQHYHLKNISSPQYLDVFQPHNVYSSSGTREGIVKLGGGAVDYRSILKYIHRTGIPASLEWFGPDPLNILKEEMDWLRKLELVNHLQIFNAARNFPE
ncbi:sugar phosphate isomerase/epimerase [Paenibacillus sp. FJAT-26967]|uniref:sugar phosphate isomerase/epimerase family protein n=1 Tax=Paenibacillus sp. FJAT-26967 TaxID=1729690 RepID=UPI00083990E4|nr:sugar phosphate isomerase/epimerase family protein [Paenibacillus sp. FJAT-26967]